MNKLSGSNHKLQRKLCFENTALGIGKLQLTGRNLGRVLSSISGFVHAMLLHCFEMKLLNLKLKTRPIQLSGSLPLDIVLPAPGACTIKLFTVVIYGGKH
jgi:hypothetical protein